MIAMPDEKTLLIIAFIVLAALVAGYVFVRRDESDQRDGACKECRESRTPAEIWVTGRVSDTEGEQWEVRGISSTEKRALEIASQPNDFIGSLPVDTDLGDGRYTWPNAYYPLSEPPPSKCPPTPLCPPSHLDCSKRIKVAEICRDCGLPIFEDEEHERRPIRNGSYLAHVKCPQPQSPEAQS